MIVESIKKILMNNDLNEQEAFNTMYSIMNGETTSAQIACFITALRMKGETINEITGCAKAMRKKAEPIKPNVEYYIDTCGTGGDGANTFNISTAVGFVVAAGGVCVAKHGNRSVSSKCGSSDVLEALGININIEAAKVKDCLENIGIGYMFAPNFHKSMKYAAATRRELGFRTIFNILGPLTNPAMAKGQVMGVFDGNLTAKLANVLKNLRVEKAMIVHGNDGLDEITNTTTTKVAEIIDNKVIEYILDPQEYGFELAEKSDLVGGEAAQNAEIIVNIFKGEKSKKRDIVVLNAAAGLYVGKKANDLSEGIKMAEYIIDSGKALEKLENMIKFTNN